MWLLMILNSIVNDKLENLTNYISLSYFLLFLPKDPNLLEDDIQIETSDNFHDSIELGDYQKINLDK